MWEKSEKGDLVMENSGKLTTLARNLRKNQTPEEARLWYQFLRKYPVRIHRQYVIGSYIVDFYCHKAKLVIELDGSQHCEPENAEYDRKRTEYLKKEGLFVMRISNRDVNEQFRNVCEAIDSAVTCRLHEE